jgi:hypothetical protein
MMLTGRRPFRGICADPDLEDGAAELISMLLRGITITQAMKHKWITDNPTATGDKIRAYYESLVSKKKDEAGESYAAKRAG